MTKHENSHISSQQTQEPVQKQNALGTIARLFWALIGNAVLAFVALGIFQRHGVFFDFGRLDLFYWVMTGLLIAVRYCDIKWLGGLTGEGEPATMGHWRKHAMLLLPIAAGIWLLAHAAAVLLK